MRSLAWLVFVLNTVLWGLYFAVTKSVLGRVDPWLFGFLELAATTPVALALLLRYGRHLTRPLLRQALGLGLTFALNTVLVTLALCFTTATNTGFFPAVGGLLAAGVTALLGQRVARRTWWAGGLGLAGALGLLLTGRAAGHGWGDVLALGGALAYLGSVFQADRLSHAAGPALWAVLGVELLTTAAVLALPVLALGRWGGAAALHPPDLALIVGVGLGASLLPAASALAFQKYVPPVTVEFIYALEPVMAVLAARWLLHETLSPAGWAAGALILTGTVLHAWPTALRPAAVIPPPL